MAVPLQLKFAPPRRRRTSSLSGAQRVEYPSPHDGYNGSFPRTLRNYPALPELEGVPYSDRRSVDADVETSLVSVPDPNAPPKCFKNIYQECIFVFTVMTATASTTILQGVTVINTASIGKGLNMTAAEITWINAGLGLGAGSFMLFFGKTADLFGRKIQLLGGMAALSLFSLIAAFAPNAIALNILCGFLGFGTAAVSPPAIGTLFATYPEGRRRNKVAGALGTGNPLGFILGSISSGLVTKWWNWRASFVTISIFFFLMTIAAVFTMPIIPRTGSVKEEAKKFDYLGTGLIITGMAIFTAALTEGPELGWKSPKVIVMIIVGLLLLVGFAWWQNIYTYPLLNPSIWRNRNYTLCIMCVLWGYMSFVTNQFWICLYMQNVQKFSPIHIAVVLLPQAFIGPLWSFIGQALVSRLSGTVIMGIGALSYLTGAILQFFVRQNTPYWYFLFPSLIITVIGADFQFIASNLYVNTQMPSQASLGAGVLQTAMRISVSIGLAISSAIYGSALTTSQGGANITFAFERAYLCSILFAGVGCLFIPFMRIGKQGGPRKPMTPSIETAENRPRTGESTYRDVECQTSYDPDFAFGQPNGSSDAVSVACTYGSEESYFPRWSWEEEREWQDQRHRSTGENVVYEVCVKCLEERKILVSNDGDENALGFGIHGYHGERRKNPMKNPPPSLVDDPRGSGPGGGGWL